MATSILPIRIGGGAMMAEDNRAFKGTDILYENYHKIVRQEEAEVFWKIYPGHTQETQPKNNSL
jgi:hypothetical protein